MHSGLGLILNRNKSLFKGLLDKFSGASAAYSLRRLAKGEGEVVRVRRASDNAEKDFSAAAVASGAMTDWVNAYTDLPLDVDSGAAAAYSLRNLKASYTGNVVEVRRSSDDAVQSFTAAEVADGTLESWVSGYRTELSVARNYTTNPYESFTNASSSGFTAFNSSGTGFAGFDLSGATGDEVEISFELTIRSGSPQIRLRAAYNSSDSSSVGTTYTTSGTKTITLTATDNFGFIAFSEGDIPSDFDVSNFQIVSRSANGHVKTWYDQSGNTNNAVQTDAASQPKIVDAGSLVSGGIDFDGTQFLGANGIASSVTGTDQPYSTFAVSKTNTTATQYLLGMGRATTSTPIKNILYHSGGNFGVQQRDDANTLKADLVASAYSTGTTYLTSTTSSGTVIDFSKNGSLDVDDLDVDVGLLTIDKVNIGARANGDADPLNGSISELIIYPTDQTDNRIAIEANIGDYYSIDLPAGVDSGNNEVDGFVTKWYDQSGNGNDAVQATAANQPKIVDTGAYLGELSFDGTDDYFALTTSLTAQPYSTFAAYSATQAISYIYSSSTLPVAGRRATGEYILHHGVALASGTHPSTEILGTYFANSTTSEIFSNGVSIASGDAGNTDNTIEYVFGRPANAFGGTAKEMIIYNSDQTANRTAIEANIADEYGITLS